MLKASTLPYLIQGMGDNFAGAHLIKAIQTSTALSTSSQDFIRLESCFGENDIAVNFNNCIAGSYQLQLRDAQFCKDAFCMDLASLKDLFANLAGGVASNVNINFL